MGTFRRLALIIALVSGNDCTNPHCHQRCGNTLWPPCRVTFVSNTFPGWHFYVIESTGLFFPLCKSLCYFSDLKKLVLAHLKTKYQHSFFLSWLLSRSVFTFGFQHIRALFLHVVWHEDIPTAASAAQSVGCSRPTNQVPALPTL